MGMQAVAKASSRVAARLETDKTLRRASRRVIGRLAVKYRCVSDTVLKTSCDAEEEGFACSRSRISQ